MLTEEEKVFDLYENLKAAGMNEEQSLIIHAWLQAFREHEENKFRKYFFMIFVVLSLYGIATLLRFFY